MAAAERREIHLRLKLEGIQRKRPLEDEVGMGDEVAADHVRGVAEAVGPVGGEATGAEAGRDMLCAGAGRDMLCAGAGRDML